MKSLFLVIAALALLANQIEAKEKYCTGDPSTERGTCASASRTRPEPTSLTTCTWYSDCTCCNVSDEPILVYSVACGELSDKCKESLDLARCLPCAPDAGLYTDGTNFRVCQNYLTKLYNDCKDEPWCNAGANCELDTNQCSTASAVMTGLNAEAPEVAFGQGVGLSFDPESNQCFNAAGALAPLMSAIVAVVVIAALSF